VLHEIHRLGRRSLVAERGVDHWVDDVVDEVLDGPNLCDHQGSLVGADADDDLNAYSHLEAVAADYRERIKELEPLNLTGGRTAVRRRVLFGPVDGQVCRRDDVGDVGPPVQVVNTGTGDI